MDTAALLDQTNIELGDGGSLFLSIVLATMIFAVALGLKPSSFAFFKKDPKHYLAGALAQLLGLPRPEPKRHPASFGRTQSRFAARQRAAADCAGVAGRFSLAATNC